MSQSEEEEEKKKEVKKRVCKIHSILVVKDKIIFCNNFMNPENLILVLNDTAARRTCLYVAVLQKTLTFRNYGREFRPCILVISKKWTISDL